MTDAPNSPPVKRVWLVAAISKYTMCILSWKKEVILKRLKKWIVVPLIRCASSFLWTEKSNDGVAGGDDRRSHHHETS